MGGGLFKVGEGGGRQGGVIRASASGSVRCKGAEVAAKRLKPQCGQR